MLIVTIYDNKSRDIGKYLIIEIGIFPYLMEGYSSEIRTILF